MRTLAALALAATVASATDVEGVSFRLPDHNGRPFQVRDFGARYLLLVYQGIP